MTTTPPEQPAGASRPTIGMPSIPSGARMPIPGNAEFALFVFLEIVLILIWIIADSYNTTARVFYDNDPRLGLGGSRGIAKASRVLEQ